MVIHKKLEGVKVVVQPGQLLRVRKKVVNKDKAMNRMGKKMKRIKIRS